MKHRIIIIWLPVALVALGLETWWVWLINNIVWAE